MAELRVKESDRLTLLAENLRAIGADAQSRDACAQDGDVLPCEIAKRVSQRSGDRRSVGIDDEPTIGFARERVRCTDCRSGVICAPIAVFVLNREPQRIRLVRDRDTGALQR